MKVRQWFVSNSSSSSFILAVPNTKKTSIEENIKNYDFLVSDNELDQWNEWEEINSKCLKELNENKRIIMISVEYGSEGLLEELSEEIDSISIIHETN